MIGIYVICNVKTDTFYVGKSVNIEKRFKNHLKNLRQNKHYNKHLQNSYNKYGEEFFEFDVVEECNENQLNEKEKYWIAYYKNNNFNLYNITDGGDGGKMPQYIIEKNRIKISNKAKGSEYVKHFGKQNGMYGKHHTEKTKNKIRQSLYSKYGVGMSSMYGKHHTEETKRKISQANKGRKHSEETKRKMHKPHKKTRWDNNKRVWSDELCSVCRLLNMSGISYIKLSKVFGVNAETVRIGVKRYEKRKNIVNNNYLYLPKVLLNSKECEK